jgi:hypothetical protein
MKKLISVVGLFVFVMLSNLVYAADQPVFDLMTPNGPFDKGQISRVIIDPKGEVAIDHYQGYMDGETFKSAGVDCFHLKDQAEVIDKEGKVTIPASTGYTDFLTAQASGMTTIPQIIEYLKTKGLIK